MANFSGTELKLQHIDSLVQIPDDKLDFEWACTASLKYFKMKYCPNKKDYQMRIIAQRLAVMPELRKVKF